jgi:hypothetical protein
MSDAEQLTPEQAIVRQAWLMGAEIAANVPDRELSARIAAEVGHVFMRAVAEHEARIAAGEVPREREQRPGSTTTEVGTVRMLGPDDVRARGWD